MGHALKFRNGGLVVFCHNEIKDKLGNLVIMACNEPFVHTNCIHGGTGRVKWK